MYPGLPIQATLRSDYSDDPNVRHIDLESRGFVCLLRRS